MPVQVLRLGHRPERDKRITTHACLVARAFGATKIVYTGVKDAKLEESVRKAASNWGGGFEIAYAKSWKTVLKAWRGKIVHLTMYGEPIQKLRMPKGNVLIIIGGEKVPGEVYGAADFNVSVTLQPHSEVAALAIFLDRLFKGKELSKKFAKPRVKVVPCKRGKKVFTAKVNKHH